MACVLLLEHHLSLPEFCEQHAFSVRPTNPHRTRLQKAPSPNPIPGRFHVDESTVTPGKVQAPKTSSVFFFFKAVLFQIHFAGCS
jgi:hypothetical protein